MPSDREEILGFLMFCADSMEDTERVLRFLLAKSFFVMSDEQAVDVREQFRHWVGLVEIPVDPTGPAEPFFAALRENGERI